MLNRKLITFNSRTNHSLDVTCYLKKMIEILKELRDSLKGRIKNRFTGTLILILISFNWKPIAIFFLSSKPIENKINYITEEYPNNPHYLNIVIPVLISIVYLPIIQWTNVLIDILTKKAVNRKRLLDQENYINNNNSEKIKALADFDLEQVKNGFKNQEALNSEIKNLKDEISNLKESSDGKNNTIVKLNSQVENLKKDLIDKKHKLELENLDKNRYRNELDIARRTITYDLTQDIKDALIDIGIHQGESHPLYSIVDKDTTEILIKNDLIEEPSYKGKGNASIELTPKGERLLGLIQKDI